jgi:hypothetical protein
MTKLRNIQTTCDNCGHTPALTDECIERIKELMLEFIGEDAPYEGSEPIDSIRLSHNSLRTELRKKVKES